MKSQVQVTLVFLVLAASFGLILRWIQIGAIFHTYKYILHTYSHIALLGWVYNGVYIICAQYLLPRKDKHFKRLFWVTQITIAGMLFSFPFQGYGPISITFSTLYLFCSYYLVYFIFKQMDSNKSYFAFLRSGGVYLILSSLGPYALGYFMANDMDNTSWYNLSIYWFLHFLYNGFFVFGILAFLLKNEEKKLTRTIFLWMNASIVPLFALSALWIFSSVVIYSAAFLGAAFQGAALYIYVKSKNFNFMLLKRSGLMLALCFFAYCLKILFQLIACFAPVQKFINTTVPFTVIRFIHLVMNGFFTLALLQIFYQQKLLPSSWTTRWGNYLLILGLILSEALLFGQGLLSYSGLRIFSHYFLILSVVSVLMPIGIIFIGHSR
ncbi:MAG: hypothetical protein AAGF85_08090 [Bacteroidota bacterium]